MTINFTEYKNKREKENTMKYAEIDTHKTYGYMSTSIWAAEDIREMFSHAARTTDKHLINEYIDRLIDGEEIFFVNNDVTSVFRIATKEDIQNSKRDMQKADEELNDFINSEEYDKNLENFLLSQFGLKK